MSWTETTASMWRRELNKCITSEELQRKSRPVKVMDVPVVLSTLGVLEEIELRIGSSKIKRILKDHPQISADMLRKLPEKMVDPMMVYMSSISSTNPDSYVAVLNMSGDDGRSVMASIDLEKRTPHKGKDYYLITSVHTRTASSFTEQATREGSLKYINLHQLRGWERQSKTDIKISQFIKKDRNGRHEVQFPGGTRSSGKNPTFGLNQIIKTQDDLVKAREVFGNKQYQNNARGSITLPRTFGAGERIQITISPKADASTAIHEMSHFFLWETGRLLDLCPGDAELIRDMQTIKQWLGWSEGQQGWTREQHEQFARAFELYLREGRSPVQEMDSVFSRFKAWLCDIYRSALDLNVELSDDMRDVFDRMLATQEEIDRDAEISGPTWQEFSGQAQQQAVRWSRETVKDAIERVSGATEISELVSESEAMQEAYALAEQESRRAYKAGRTEGVLIATAKRKAVEAKRRERTETRGQIDSSPGQRDRLRYSRQYFLP